MQFGLIGLGASGKTTVFNTLTGRDEPVDTYGAQPGAVSAVVQVPDPRLDKIAEHLKPPKTTPATFDLFDITGLFDENGAVRADLLAQVREMDGLGLVVRAFTSDDVLHPKNRVDAQTDLNDIHAELVMADQMICEKRIERITASVKRPIPNKEELLKEKEILERCLTLLEDGGRVADLGLSEEDSRIIRGFCLLTEMPQVVILNTGEDHADKLEEAIKAITFPGEVTAACGKLEMELAQLDEEERREFLDDLGIADPARDRLVGAIYAQLGLISFLTFGEDECRAWTIMNGDSAVAAAGAIHSDLARGFIRAEVFHFDDWTAAAGDEKQIKADGRLRLEGKEYTVLDGDMIVVRFSV